MTGHYIKPDAELLAFQAARLIADSGNAQGTGQDLTTVDVDPNELFF